MANNNGTGEAGYFKNNSKDNSTILVENSNKDTGNGLGQAGKFLSHSDDSTIWAENKGTGPGREF